MTKPFLKKSYTESLSLEITKNNQYLNLDISAKSLLRNGWFWCDIMALILVDALSEGFHVISCTERLSVTEHYFDASSGVQNVRLKKVKG